ncbi:MAG: hypothetical protein JWP04_449 [Belnapia sp.]|nr:hypothetical protein [Belnapia sp.]
MPDSNLATRLRALAAETTAALIAAAEALEAPPPPVVVEPPPPAPGKVIDWAKTGREVQAYFATTGKWASILVYADGTRDGPMLPVVPPVVVQPPTVPAEPAGRGLALAQAFHRKAVFTVNWERERFSANFKYDAAVDAYYTGLDVGGIRCFMPWKPAGVKQQDGSVRNFWDLSVGKAPTRDQFMRFAPNMKAIVAAKKLLMIDLLDACGLEDFTPALLPVVEAYLRNAAGWIREMQLDPAYLCIGPVNEWAGGKDADRNATYEALRLRFHSILRGELPEPFLLGQSPAYWGHHDSYTGSKNGRYNPGDDLATVHFWHAYDRNSAAGWAKVQAGIDAWSAANGGRVVMCGEVGPGGLYDGKDFKLNDGGWVEHIRRQNPVLANSVPCLWACTTGDWAMNRGANDPRFWTPKAGWEPDIEGAVRAAAASNRKARGL